MSLLYEGAATLAASGFIQSAARYWRSLVDQEVHEPYLDEYFHVGQAQTYCAGRYSEWDPKITTPPGLYFASQAWLYLRQLPCNVSALRTTSEPFLAVVTLFSVVAILSLRRPRDETDDYNVTHFRIHSAVNICLFPPLFFFSALYYTDVASTALVLLHLVLSEDLRVRRYSFGSARVALSSLGLLLTGSIALLFRQTNVFWVAIYPAGLSLLSLFPSTVTSGDYSQILDQAYSEGLAYDVSVADASVDDVFKFAISIVAVVCGALLRSVKPSSTKNKGPNVLSILTSTLSFGILLAGFAAFIVWNGGVVLGDKSNHVATIHIPQMLYIWPYIAFFSWPVMLPALFGSLVPSHVLPSQLKQYTRGSVKLSVLNIFVLSVITGAAFIAVRYNTIVHPFTLADNRHYVFYVFRILRRPIVKYSAIPAYILCSWISIQSVALSQRKTPETPRQRAKAVRNTGSKHHAGTGVQSTTSTGHIAVWVVTSTLCLVTAPLVEPRYFILPWVTWRLMIPTPRRAEGKKGQRETTKLIHLLVGSEPWTWLETIWYIAVNYATAYMFLNRGFEWPQEPGKVQRFMW